MKIRVPVPYSAWLSGELGQQLRKQLQDALSPAEVTMLPRGLLVETDECAGPRLEATARAVEELEDAVEARYPIFWHDMGPVWTGTLQAVFPARPRAESATGADKARPRTAAPSKPSRTALA